MTPDPEQTDRLDRLVARGGRRTHLDGDQRATPIGPARNDAGLFPPPDPTMRLVPQASGPGPLPEIPPSAPLPLSVRPLKRRHAAAATRVLAGGLSTSGFLLSVAVLEVQAPSVAASTAPSMIVTDAAFDTTIVTKTLHRTVYVNENGIPTVPPVPPTAAAVAETLPLPVDTTLASVPLSAEAVPSSLPPPPSPAPKPAPRSGPSSPVAEPSPAPVADLPALSADAPVAPTPQPVVSPPPPPPQAVAPTNAPALPPAPAPAPAATPAPPPAPTPAPAPPPALPVVTDSPTPAATEPPPAPDCTGTTC